MSKSKPEFGLPAIGITTDEARRCCDDETDDVRDVVVYPREADIALKCISALAPVGAAKCADRYARVNAEQASSENSNAEPLGPSSASLHDFPFRLPSAGTVGPRFETEVEELVKTSG